MACIWMTVDIDGKLALTLLDEATVLKLFSQNF